MKNLQRREKTCWQYCIQKILDDIIGSNNTIPVKDFENNLKKYFENIVFRDSENIKEKGNEELFYSQLIISQNLTLVHRRTAGMGNLFDQSNISMGCNFHQFVISMGR
jgi:hypothetical protein